MTKRVELTENIKNYMDEKGISYENPSQFVLYQVRATSSEPITQPSTIYHKAVFTRSALVDMAEIINDPKNTSPLQILHAQNSIPYGRIVHAEVVDENEMVSALYLLFMISSAHSEYIDKIDTGILDEVSISAMPKKMLCSECGKDFLDDDVPVEALWSKTCPECQAVMGKDGAHLNVPSTEYFYELSLVPRGAAKHPKILDEVYQIAMSDTARELTPKMVRDSLTGISLISRISEEVEMNVDDVKAVLAAELKPLNEELSNIKTTLASVEEEKKNLEAAKEEAEQAKATAEEEKTNLEASVTSLTEEKAKLEQDLAAEKKAHQEVLAAFSEEVKKVLVAAGKAESEVPADLAGMQEALKDAHLILAGMPVGGVSKPSFNGNGMSSKEDYSVYKINN